MKWLPVGFQIKHKSSAQCKSLHGLPHQTCVPSCWVFWPLLSPHQLPRTVSVPWMLSSFLPQGYCLCFSLRLFPFAALPVHPSYSWSLPAHSELSSSYILALFFRQYEYQTKQYLNNIYHFFYNVSSIKAGSMLVLHNPLCLVLSMVPHKE